MALPKTTRVRVEKMLDAFCETKVPPHTVERVKLVYRIRGNSVTLFEQRSFPFDIDQWEESKVAQFRYDPNTKKWTLYFTDRNSRWQEHFETPPTSSFASLLKEVDKDPTGIFWG